MTQPSSYDDNNQFDRVRLYANRRAGNHLQETKKNKAKYDIVVGIISYLECNGLNIFNKYSIYDYSFEKSYTQAISDVEKKQKDNILRNLRVVFYNPTSKFFKTIPKELILNILRFGHLLINFPNCKEFQLEIWSQLSNKNDDTDLETLCYLRSLPSNPYTKFELQRNRLNLAADNYKHVKDSNGAIVVGIKSYLDRDRENYFNLYSIYSYSFKPSYKEAIKALTEEQRRNFFWNTKISYYRLSNPTSNICKIIPREIFFKILQLGSLSISFLTCKEFQLGIWNQLPDKENASDQNAIEYLKLASENCLIQ